MEEEHEIRALRGQVRYSESVPEFEKMMTHMRSYRYKLEDYLLGKQVVSLDRMNHWKQIVMQAGQMEYLFDDLVREILSYPQDDARTKALMGVQDEFRNDLSLVRSAYQKIMSWHPKEIEKDRAS